MKKILLYLLVIVALGATAWFLINKNNQRSSFATQESNWDFGILDTNTITRIEITDKVPSKVVLTKQPEGWMVNDKYSARPDAIEVLLETMHRQTMRNFVPEPALANVAKRIAVFGKEVKVFAGDKLIKHFYVGTETPDQLGTFMMLDGADKPYAVHVQGFNGYLNSRYFTDEALWRNRLIFGQSVSEIAEVTIEYPTDTAESFKITNNNGKFALTTLQGTPITDALNINVNVFLGSFRTANYEGMVVETDGVWARRDSLTSFAPVFVLNLKDTDGQMHQLKAYRKGADREQFDENGEQMITDPDRLYAFLDDGRWVVIQYFGLRNIIVTREFFGLELRTDN